MMISTSEALRTPGRNFPFSVEVEIKAFDNDKYISICNPILVTGNIMYTSEDFLLRGSFEANYSTQCALCECNIDDKLEITFDEEFALSDDLDHPDRFVFQGTTIDLSKMVLDNIYLYMPMKHVCSASCKGLCIVCGCNQNDTECDCNAPISESYDENQAPRSEEYNNPFAVLRDLIDDEEEEV